MSEQGLDIDLKTLEDQRRDAAAEFVDATEELLAGRKSIALSRTMLQAVPVPRSKASTGFGGVESWMTTFTLEGLVHDADGFDRNSKA